MTTPKDLKSLYYAPLLPIIWILEVIVWLFRPRIMRVTEENKDFAKYLTIHGGAKIIKGRR